LFCRFTIAAVTKAYYKLLRSVTISQIDTYPRIWLIIICFMAYVKASKNSYALMFNAVSLCYVYTYINYWPIDKTNQICTTHTSGCCSVSTFTSASKSLTCWIKYIYWWFKYTVLFLSTQLIDRFIIWWQVCSLLKYIYRAHMHKLTHTHTHTRAHTHTGRHTYIMLLYIHSYCRNQLNSIIVKNIL